MTGTPGVLEVEDPRTDEVHFSVVRARAGCSYRQLDYWVRTGVLTPSIRPARGSGTQRGWSRADADVAVVVARFARLGAHRDVLKWAADTTSDLLAAGVTEAWLLVDAVGATTVTFEPAAALGTYGEGCWLVPICPPAPEEPEA